jgi:hypothetical protein
MLQVLYQDIEGPFYQIEENIFVRHPLWLSGVIKDVLFLFQEKVESRVQAWVR